MKRRITLVQINYDASDTRRHIERIKGVIAENKSSDLIVFPELILHGHASLEKPEGFLYRRTEGRGEHHLSEEIAQFVKEMDARVLLGQIMRRGDMFYNLATYMDFATVQSYTKTHVHWTERFIPGRELKVISTPAGRLGLTICFDAAFPEIGRVLALRGAEIIINISAVPKTFAVKYMWRRLAAMALNNQVYVVYVNRPGPYFAGHSAVFDPRGNLMAHTGKEEEVFDQEIDFDLIGRWREEEMIYRHRRPLLYREIGRETSKRAGVSKMPKSKKRVAAARKEESSLQAGGSHG